VLARRELPARFAEWNARWGAPDGRPQRAARVVRARLPWLVARYPQIAGPFAFQANNETRVVEYPWAYFALPVVPGLSAVEIGGSLSGFQFALAKSGAHVVNVDPGEAASGIGWPCDAASIARLNRAFGTGVRLVNTTLEAAGLPDASADVVYSISTIEHIPEDELPRVAHEIARILRPGGHAVLTIDLFLTLTPFTARTRNRGGWNIDVKQFVDQTGLDLIAGDPRELNGFPEFDREHVLSSLDELMYGTYPACAQLLVLQKPD
jgi:SAM-dependent methyltransferase